MQILVAILNTPIALFQLYYLSAIHDALQFWVELKAGSVVVILGYNSFRRSLIGEIVELLNLICSKSLDLTLSQTLRLYLQSDLLGQPLI